MLCDVIEVCAQLFGVSRKPPAEARHRGMHFGMICSSNSSRFLSSSTSTIIMFFSAVKPLISATFRKPVQGALLRVFEGLNIHGQLLLRHYLLHLTKVELFRIVWQQRLKYKLDAQGY